MKFIFFFCLQQVSTFTTLQIHALNFDCIHILPQPLKNQRLTSFFCFQTGMTLKVKVQLSQLTTSSEFQPRGYNLGCLKENSNDPGLVIFAPDLSELVSWGVQPCLHCRQIQNAD